MRLGPGRRCQVNAIKIPGFTASSSLYLTVGQYRNASVLKQAYQDARQTVSPAVAQFCNNTCFRGCLRTCSADCGELSGLARAICFQNCRMECRGECCQSQGPTVPPPRPNPCPPGWRWVSGPEWCPTCCREFSDGTASCQQPLCAPRGDDR